MDLLAAGLPMSCVTVGSHANKAPVKRKAESGDVEQPKKRGRAKKVVVPQPEEEPESVVKQEATPETEGLGGDDGTDEEI